MIQPNQKKTIDEILETIRRGLTFVMLLLAQMQSGKTGTYLGIAIDSICNDDVDVDEVIIISGLTDKLLKQQLKQNLDEAIRKHCEITNNLKIYLKLTEKIKIYWSQDLKKVLEIKDKTLIIHEESHAAQSKENRPFKFYEKYGLSDGLHMNTSELQKRNIRFLNVSATPFSELACNDGRSVFMLQPGEDYRGIGNLLDTDKINFTAKPIKDTSHAHIRSTLTKPKYNGKYCIVRSQRAEKDRELMESIANCTGCIYHPIFGGKQDISNQLDFLKEGPKQKTLVHICGKLRVGQVLPKDHIGMVYEQSKSAKIDTILQGLLGRVCGYYTDKQTVPDVYVSESVKDEVRSYASGWGKCDYTNFGVTRAMNLFAKSAPGIVTNKKTGRCFRELVPVPLDYSKFEKGYGEEAVQTKKIQKNEVLNYLQDNPDLLKDHKDKDEIMKSLNGPSNLGKRNINCKTYVKRDTEGRLRDAVENNRPMADCMIGGAQNNSDTTRLEVIGGDHHGYLIGFIPCNDDGERKVHVGVLKKCMYKPPPKVV